LGVFLLGLGGGFLFWKFLYHRNVITNSIGMEFRRIPAGTFVMGSSGADARDDEEEHEVEITRPFYLGRFEVTQDQFERVMGYNPSVFTAVRSRGKKPAYPVETVSWFQALDFCKKLSELPEEKKAGRIYRLPTEAEWEYACRAGRRGEVYGYGDV